MVRPSSPIINPRSHISAHSRSLENPYFQNWKIEYKLPSQSRATALSTAIRWESGWVFCSNHCLNTLWTIFRTVSDQFLGFPKFSIECIHSSIKRCAFGSSISSALFTYFSNTLSAVWRNYFESSHRSPWIFGWLNFDVIPCFSSVSIPSIVFLNTSRSPLQLSVVSQAVVTACSRLCGFLASIIIL